MTAVQHIVPENDLHEHVTDDLCPCLPRALDINGDPIVPGCTAYVVRHNSYDGRELPEVCMAALDALGMALVDHRHEWSIDERDAYEHAVQLCQMHGAK